MPLWKSAEKCGTLILTNGLPGIHTGRTPCKAPWQTAVRVGPGLFPPAFRGRRQLERLCY